MILFVVGYYDNNDDDIDEIYFLYSVRSIYALSAVQLLKYELIYILFSHTDIHMAAIVGAGTIAFTPNFHTSEVAEVSMLNILNALGGIRTSFSRVW